jgi:tRNA(Ile)-lysidine synthase
MRSRPLEVKALEFFRALGAKRFLVAVSGGVDSMALAHVCANLKDKIPGEFVIAHIHHGAGANAAYRDRARKFVADFCAEKGLVFVTNPGGAAASGSESDLRKFRLAELKKLKIENRCDYVVFAHHADDLLETRLIRLVRGTGPQGLASMREINGAVLRPFLSFPKVKVELYLELLEESYLEDPSNRSVEYLRNWIRAEWLPALEAKRPGSTRKMAQSLVNLVEALDSVPAPVNCIENFKIVRQKFLVLTPSDKRRVLGAYLDQSGFKDYGLSHINELIKRLDVEQKDLTFRLLKKIWLANAKHIWCE